tara:strand:+ start:943 stop:1749 length:807 start_codon:yes stop_codon:yes gene_type:complete
MKPTICITGAGGYLGHSLLKRLIDTRKYNINLLFEDITDLENFKIDADIVIHLAAKLPSFKGDMSIVRKTNYDATKQIASACKDGAYFMFLSTDYVFNSDPDKAHNEDDPKTPETEYGVSKSMAEDFLLSCKKLNTIILRTSMLYGYDHPKRKNFFRFLYEKVSEGEEVELFTDVYSRPTYIEDINNFIIKAIEERTTGVVHACGNEYINRYDLGCMFCDANGFDKKLLIPAEMPDDGRWPTALNLNPSDIFLNVAKTTILKGVTQCL